MEDKKPTLKLAKVKADSPTIIKFDLPTPAVTGESRYGSWELYNIQVTNQTVVSRAKEDMQNYTGEAVIFMNPNSTGYDGAVRPNKFYTKVRKLLDRGVLEFEVTKKARISDNGKPFIEYMVSHNGEEITAD